MGQTVNFLDNPHFYFVLFDYGCNSSHNQEHDYIVCSDNSIGDTDSNPIAVGRLLFDDDDGS